MEHRSMLRQSPAISSLGAIKWNASFIHWPRKRQKNAIIPAKKKSKQKSGISYPTPSRAASSSSLRGEGEEM
ncbi:hypothetical protein SODALDRAFT_115179 [Sodiomyces alkalinus F11]|uniref:Uncharacterized protein n=1 Tax=Sodiomyces alkalinus (strain CBS 110278 / VKM F-3762 / F11) TaxID=1314773 RepID=A0A3N2Q3F8_SODAK|nr:hypothetical protein SODALDRAFT_115179 [Sodiomyces alkalinus F11]ROT41247.1 hypothetical protein SODALDRAFT_115179 [Sodiomyces alkalinus F11]